MTDHSSSHDGTPPLTAQDAALPLGMPATRKLSAHDLGLVSLALLADEESYGSQLSDRIERLSNGFYRPSPGVLYPLLGVLSERGSLTQYRRGRRKYYRLTSRGEAYLGENAEAANRVEARLRSAGRKLNALYASINQTLDDDTLAMPLAQEMLSARMDLKAALHESRHASPDAQRRILRLLQDTAERIRAAARD
ncbi:transcriptional regulator YqjI [Halomonas elongata]|uniref:Transcriptional regulator YqjI n=1 Tax=Halomonas elongata TaxID=2746 RepID=A0A1B8NVA9_HALEL|nr:PadR family transcriptional regulator [Halomonas elongata]OBX33941.1 transcriptional regulator YqjI [Halomonas elongata]